MLERRNRAADANPVTPTGTTDTLHSASSTDHNRARFTRLYYRSPCWDCGCHLPCRCEFRANPTPKRVDAYKDAVEHLTAHGLLPAALMPEARQLWKRGGADRTLSEIVVQRWAA